MVKMDENGWRGSNNRYYGSADEAAASLTINTEGRFNRLVARLLVKSGYALVKQDATHSADIIATHADRRVVFSIKIHRSEQIAQNSIRNAAARLAKDIRFQHADGGVIIITQPINREKLDLSADMEIWDLPALLARAKPYPDLTEDLIELLRGLQVLSEGPLVAQEPRARLDPIPEILAQASSERLDPSAGEAIVGRLEALEPGKPDAKAFEKLCEEALCLMFGTEFVGWRAQNEVNDGFHKMDLIARLVPTQNPFWSTIAHDFRTRYVVFEFKNYRDPISQDQIYSTEKYMFATALRSVALLIARNGKSLSADKAIRGSLREQGKLIICISLDDLCSMLRKRDSGGDPTDFLYDKVDELLMTVAR